MLEEIRKSEGGIILFIDELHTIVAPARPRAAWTPATSKAHAGQGRAALLGATTLDEYRKYIEKDAALERRFQPVQVDEPTVEDTISILRGLKERYEVYHGVRIHDNALVAAATLSNRYISDRFLPDKAIDLVDEACALIRTEIDSMPAELDDMRRRIMQLEIEGDGSEERGRQAEPGPALQAERGAGQHERQLQRHEVPLGRGKEQRGRGEASEIRDRKDALGDRERPSCAMNMRKRPS